MFALVFRGRRRAAASAVGAVAAALTLSVTAAGCGSDSGLEPVTRAGDSGRPVWETRGLTSYRYTLRVQAFFAGGNTPVRVEVRDGVPTVIDLPVAGGGGDYSRYDTIPELLDLIDNARRNGAAQVNAEYDPTYGFPSSAFIDYDARLADDEIGFTVTDFAPL
jgi:hypothetical protein